MSLIFCVNLGKFLPVKQEKSFAIFSAVLCVRCKCKLSRRHWGELRSLFRRLRSLQGFEAASEVVKDLSRFLEPMNAGAYRSLLEAGEDLMALHRLNVPNTLHRSLLSTNAIENSFLNTRRRLRRATRFRAEIDQASRWLAYALLVAEKGFRKIHAHRRRQSPQPLVAHKQLPIQPVPLTL